jgi:hypothetical protein
MKECGVTETRNGSLAAFLLAITIGLLAAVTRGAQSTPAGTERNPSGSAAAKGACDAPRECVKVISEGNYDAVGGLFADDAVYMGPDGTIRHGAKEIGKFYKKFLSAYKPQIRAASFIQQDNDCILELEGKSKKSGEYAFRGIDHFTIDSEGKVAKFVVYLRPGNSSQKEMSVALAKVR